jgi:hypothetical protein
LDKIKPVKPPIVNKKIKPITQNNNGWTIKTEPYKVANQLKILIPVGTE